jgi:negative regulator of flagellin synthesis FlgM
MSDLAPVSGSPGPAGASFERLDSAPSRPPAARYPDRPADRPSDRPSDRVEFSDRARLLSKLASRSAPPMRQDLIDRIRTQIADGTYETEEKLEAAIQALAQDLES